MFLQRSFTLWYEQLGLTKYSHVEDASNFLVVKETKNVVESFSLEVNIPEELTNLLHT